MSQLITIAERIKVITNIQKTAHAMQLLSMSMLSRIGNKKRALQLYTQHLQNLTKELDLETASPASQKPIYLIISSQKSFCGSFNITLFNFIKELQKKEPLSSCLALGPYAHDFCKEQKIGILHDKMSYSLATLSEKATALFDILMRLKDTHDSIIILSNYNASIFLQRPHKIVLPLHYTAHKKSSPETFHTEQPYAEITEYIANLTLKTHLFQILLESLRAENSARALAMDSSTRNAKNLLTQMKLEYNKLRQAKVTKELTELSSSLLDV